MPVQKPKYKAKEEQLLMTELWDPQIADDLEAFIMFAYPWKKAGTPLEAYDGPRVWQRDEAQAITEHIRNNKEKVANGLDPIVYKSATGSGRGIGKSAFLAMMNQWHVTCRIGGTAITTANSESQLKTRTWAEFGKWKTLLINSHWFELQTMKMYPATWLSQLVKDQLKTDTTYWYAEAQLWSEENPDSFAGVHNPIGVMLNFDEASGIPANIWDVSTGFFTDVSSYHFHNAFSNPRRSTGSFFECFHKNRKFWRHQQIDSRTVEGLNR
jgi:hypothetical protein